VIGGQSRLQPGSSVTVLHGQAAQALLKQSAQQTVIHEYFRPVHQAPDRNRPADGRSFCCAGWRAIGCCRLRPCRM